MNKARADQGLTLVELIVTTMLVSLVLVVVGGVMISITTTQRQVTVTTAATTAAQSAASGIASGIRNSSEFSLTTVGGTNQLLVTRTANQGATITWNCHGWYFSSADGSIKTTVTADGVPITAPTATQLATWTSLVSHVAPRSGGVIFASVPGGISIAYDAQVTGQDPITIQTTAVKRTGVAEAHSCF